MAQLDTLRAAGCPGGVDDGGRVFFLDDHCGCLARAYFRTGDEREVVDLDDAGYAEG